MLVGQVHQASERELASILMLRNVNKLHKLLNIEAYLSKHSLSQHVMAACIINKTR